MNFILKYLFLCKQHLEMNIINNILSRFNKKNTKSFNNSRIEVLRSNEILTNDVVLYFENEKNVEVNKYLIKKYNSLNSKLQEKGMQLVYIPLIKKDSLINNDCIDYLKYSQPDIFHKENNNNQDLISEVINEINIFNFYQLIGEIFGINTSYSPCLIHSVDVDNEMNSSREFKYSIYFIDLKEIDKSIDFYVRNVSIKISKIYFSLSNNKKEYDADDEFSKDGNILSQKTLDYLNALKKIDNNKILVSSLVYIIKNLSKNNPELKQLINSKLYNTVQNAPAQISRLSIDKQYNIFLTDYNNTEIKLTPLPKTVFLFLLNYPEGMMFKDLSKYRKELFEIYTKVGNRLDIDVINKSIDELININSNSINEKCSRIKEAFVTVIDTHFAENYYVTGGRNNVKRIKLDRSLVNYI